MRAGNLFKKLKRRPVPIIIAMAFVIIVFTGVNVYLRYIEEKRAITDNINSILHIVALSSELPLWQIIDTVLQAKGTSMLETREITKVEILDHRDRQIFFGEIEHISNQERFLTRLEEPVKKDGEVIGRIVINYTSYYLEQNLKGSIIYSVIQTILMIVIIGFMILSMQKEITVRKHAEEALNISLNKLQEQETRKTETLYMVTHDLRTPMTSIVGFSRLISQKYQAVLMPLLQNSTDKKVNRTTEQVMNNIKIIEEEGQRLTGLINNFLDLSKLEEGKVTLNPERINVDDCVKQSLDAVSALFGEKNLETVVEIAPEVVDIEADREKLIQVMINLLSNAIKFTPEGSVTCRAEKDDKRVIISITDTGLGMTPAEQEEAFEKFKQVGKQDGSKQKGTGLGLPICKHIIEMHGGEIWVKSEPGQGSTFSFSLPISPDAHVTCPNRHLLSTALLKK